MLLAILLLLLVATVSLLHFAWSLEVQQRSRAVAQMDIAELAAESALVHAFEFLKAWSAADGGIDGLPGRWEACAADDGTLPCSASLDPEQRVRYLRYLDEPTGAARPWLVNSHSGFAGGAPWPVRGAGGFVWQVAALLCSTEQPESTECRPHASRNGAWRRISLLAQVGLIEDGETLTSASATVSEFPLVASGPPLAALSVDDWLRIERQPLDLLGAFADSDPVLRFSSYVENGSPGPMLRVCGESDAFASGRDELTCTSCACLDGVRLAALATPTQPVDATRMDVGTLLFGLPPAADDVDCGEGSGERCALDWLLDEYAVRLQSCTGLDSTSRGLLHVIGDCELPASEVGKAADPLILLVDGDVYFASGTLLHGALVVRGDAGQGRIHGERAASVFGAVFAAGSLQIDGGLAVHAVTDLRERLVNALGLRRWGMVPGSWREDLEVAP